MIVRSFAPLVALLLVSGCSGAQTFVAIEETQTYDSQPTMREAAATGTIAFGDTRQGNCGTAYCQFPTGKGVVDFAYASSFRPYPIAGGARLSVQKPSTLYRESAMKTRIADIAQGTPVVAVEGIASLPAGVVLLVDGGKPLGYARRADLAP